MIHIFHLHLRLQSFLLPLPVAVAGNDDNDGHTNSRPHNCTSNGSRIVATGVIVITVIGTTRAIAPVITAVVVTVLVVTV